MSLDRASSPSSTTLLWGYVRFEEEVAVRGDFRGLEFLLVLEVLVEGRPMFVDEELTSLPLVGRPRLLVESMGRRAAPKG